MTTIPRPRLQVIHTSTSARLDHRLTELPSIVGPLPDSVLGLISILAHHTPECESLALEYLEDHV